MVAMVTSMDIEKKYVRKAYGYLASQSDFTHHRNGARKLVIRWINVQKFVNQLPIGTIVIDIGKRFLLINLI